jgi:flagellar biosynthesis protein
MTKSKTTKAAALRYDRDESPAPRVVARGDGLIAERILAIAREHNIPIHQDPALVNVLSQLDLDQQIPPALYLAIAEVLAFLYRTGALEPTPAR